MSCPTPQKQAYMGIDGAARAARRALAAHQVTEYPYPCACGRWHVTKKKPKGQFGNRMLDYVLKTTIYTYRPKERTMADPYKTQAKIDRAWRIVFIMFGVAGALWLVGGTLRVVAMLNGVG